MILSFLKKNEFIRHVVILMSGSLIGQIIPIVASPIITRVYAPENFGLFSLYASIASILASIACGRYEQAIMLPKENKEAKSVFILSIIVAFVFCLFLFFTIFIFHNEIVKILGEPKLSSWLYFLPITTFFLSLFPCYFLWLNRSKQYKQLSYGRVLQSISVAVVNIVVGIIVGGIFGLIFGQIFGQLVGITYFIIIISFSFEKHDISRHDLLFAAKKYAKFPKYNSLRALLNSFSSSLPVFVLSKAFDVTVLGFYALAMRLIQTPVSMLGNTISSVLYQRIVCDRNNHISYLNNIKKFIFLQISISLFCFSSLFFISNYLGIIFGEKWESVGEYVQYLIPWLMMVFITSPLSFSVNLANRQDKALLVEFFYSVLKFGSLCVGAFYFHDIKETLLIFSISNSLFLMFQGRWFFMLLKAEDVR